MDLVTLPGVPRPSYISMSFTRVFWGPKSPVFSSISAICNWNLYRWVNRVFFSPCLSVYSDLNALYASIYGYLLSSFLCSSFLISLSSTSMSRSALVMFQSSRASSLDLTNRPLAMYQVEGLHDVFFVSFPVGSVRIPLHMDYESVCGLVALGSYSIDREGCIGCVINGQAHIASISIATSNISGNFLDYFCSPIQPTFPLLTSYHNPFDVIFVAFKQFDFWVLVWPSLWGRYPFSTGSLFFLYWPQFWSW